MSFNSRFEITDGWGKVWLSPALCTSQTKQEEGDPDNEGEYDPSYCPIETANDDGPCHEKIKENQDNYLYVCVKRIGDYVNGKSNTLRAYIARGGPQFNAGTLEVVNSTWGDDWDVVAGDKVLQIGSDIDLNTPTNYINEGGCHWFEFVIPSALVPPYGTSWHPCILAEVESADADSGTVADDRAFAQKNIRVEAKDSKTFTKSISLGNFPVGKNDTAPRVVIDKSGPAAEGATIELEILHPGLKKDIEDLNKVIDKIASHGLPHWTAGGGIPAHIASHLDFGTVIPNSVFNEGKLPDGWNTHFDTDKKLVFDKLEGAFLLPMKEEKYSVQGELKITVEKKGKLVVDIKQIRENGLAIGGFTYEFDIDFE